MNRRWLLAGIVAVVVAATSIYLYFQLGATSAEQRTVSLPKLDPDAIPYSLSDLQIKDLQAKGERGDCVASRLLAKYYLYGALELNNGIKWLRVAAKCPDADIKAYLAMMLIKRDGYTEVAAEVDKLVAEIRLLNPPDVVFLEKQISDQK